MSTWLITGFQDLCGNQHPKEVFRRMGEAFSSFGVKHFMAVSCLNGKNLPELKNLLIELALKQRYVVCGYIYFMSWW